MVTCFSYSPQQLPQSCCVCVMFWYREQCVFMLSVIHVDGDPDPWRPTAPQATPPPGVRAAGWGQMYNSTPQLHRGSPTAISIHYQEAATRCSLCFPRTHTLFLTSVTAQNDSPPRPYSSRFCSCLCPRLFSFLLAKYLKTLDAFQRNSQKRWLTKYLQLIGFWSPFYSRWLQQLS